jgi:hypothetical protein
MESIGADYAVSKSRVCESIPWVEDILGKDKTFKLSGKSILKDPQVSITGQTERRKGAGENRGTGLK